MNTLLIFFALPIAVIIISIALQKIFKCAFLVSGIIFSIFLVVTFVIGNLTFLIATIAYTILSFITAIITKIVCRILIELEERNLNRVARNREENNGNLLTISSTGCNGIENELLTINSSCRRNNNSDTSSNCNGSTNRIAVNANVFPNNNGNSGNFTGCFRRR